MITYHQTKFGSKRISCSVDAVETVVFRSYEPLLSCYDLDPPNSKSVFSHALRLMAMHHITYFGNKILGGLEDIIWAKTDILTLYCDLDSGCSYPFFFTRHSGLR